MQIINREQWLTVLAEELRKEVLKPAGFKIPKYRVSCSFPSNRGTSNSNRCIGQCWHDGNKSGVIEILISPALEAPVEVAATLLHEMGHAALPKGTGHKKPFARFCKAVGLEGKPTHTNAGEDLAYKLLDITTKIGDYPHDKLDNFGQKKQPTRLLKVWCPVCYYVIRVTSKWIDSDGCPICPTCNVPMEEPSDETNDNPLSVCESHTEYEIKGTQRFTVRCSKKGRKVEWTVIDYGTGFFDSKARLTSCESKQDSLDLITSIQEGILTYADLDEEIDNQDVDVDDDYEDGTEEDWAIDAEEMNWLDDDEDEEYDYDINRDLLGNIIEVDDDLVDREADKREEAGRIKSEQIAIVV